MCTDWAGLNINIAPCTGDGDEEVRHDVVEPVEPGSGSDGDDEVQHNVVEPVELDRDSSGDLTSWSTAIEVKMLDATV